MLAAMTSAADDAGHDAVAALDAALPSGDIVDDVDVLGNLGNAALQLGDDDAPAALLRSGALPGAGSGAVMVVLYALQRLCFGQLSPATGSRCAAARTRRWRSPRASASRP